MITGCLEPLFHTILNQNYIKIYFFVDDEPRVEKSSIEFMLMTRKGNKQQVCNNTVYQPPMYYKLKKGEKQ